MAIRSLETSSGADSGTSKQSNNANSDNGGSNNGNPSSPSTSIGGNKSSDSNNDGSKSGNNGSKNGNNNGNNGNSNNDNNGNNKGSSNDTNNTNGTNNNDDNKTSFRKFREAPMNSMLYKLIGYIAIISLVFYSVYVRARYYVRQGKYVMERQSVYRNSTPQQVRTDVAKLTKVPHHVALILHSTQEKQVPALNALVEQAIQGANWCIGSGTKQLTLYERSGVLKLSPPNSVANLLIGGLKKVFSADEIPMIIVHNGNYSATAGHATNNNDGNPILEVFLESESSGRPLLVDLARDYSSQIANGQLKESDITVDKVDHDIKEQSGPEPDLLISFESTLQLQGFSPWLMRVTELYNLPDNNGVFHYMVFYLALQKFAGVKVNLGA